MKFFPYEKIIYDTGLELKEVQYRLDQVIEPNKSVKEKRGLINKTDYLFKGHLYQKSFDVVNIIRYRNSFLPQINGQMIENNGSTKVIVKMSLHIVVVLFLINWFLILLLFSFDNIVIAITNMSFETEELIILVLLLFGYGITLIGFNYEKKKAKKYFEKILLKK